MAHPSIGHLQDMPLFGGTSAQAIAVLLQGARMFERQEGGFFVREGDVTSSLYVLLHGAVAVRRHWGEREVLLRRLEAGDCFGEMAPLDLHPRSASVQALEPSRAMEIRAEQLLVLFETMPEQFALIQMNIARELSRRLRRLHNQLFGATSDAERALVERILQREP